MRKKVELQIKNNLVCFIPQMLSVWFGNEDDKKLLSAARPSPNSQAIPSPSVEEKRPSIALFPLFKSRPTALGRWIKIPPHEYIHESLELELGLDRGEGKLSTIVTWNRKIAHTHDQKDEVILGGELWGPDREGWSMVVFASGQIMAVKYAPQYDLLYTRLFVFRFPTRSVVDPFQSRPYSSAVSDVWSRRDKESD